jgi:hypothetical protein
LAVFSTILAHWSGKAPGLSQPEMSPARIATTNFPVENRTPFIVKSHILSWSAIANYFAIFPRITGTATVLHLCQNPFPLGRVPLSLVSVTVSIATFTGSGRVRFNHGVVPEVTAALSIDHSTVGTFSGISGSLDSRISNCGCFVSS